MSPRTNWISLSKADTGFVFATTHSVQGLRWDWISTVASEEFGHPAEDFYCMEDDEGREFVAYAGEKLIEIHNGRVVGNAAGVGSMTTPLRPVIDKVYPQFSDADYANWRWTDEQKHHNVSLMDGVR